ncbi:hypothetical protein NNO_2156 [Hydrogenimonas sp.]|nr:hypothetical protein NNO_2156 [Hydrogenimonas sp.]
MGRFFFPLILVLVISGCTTDNSGNGGFESREPPAQQRGKYRTFISDEELKTQKELAQIEAKKSVEIEKISSETKLKELELRKRAELELMREKERMLRIEHEQSMERYMLLGAILLLLLAGAALLWYFDRRRKDKLRAYEDNLKKYFHQKENESRIKIAEKILDTVASKDLSSEQRAKLIEALHGSSGRIVERREEVDPADREESEEAILIETEDKERDDGTKK